MSNATDKRPGELSRELLDLLTRHGLPQTIAAFKAAVNPRSEAHRKVVEVEVRFRELQREFLEGQISKEEESVESNRLTKHLINLIEGLETDPTLLSPRKAVQRKVLSWGLSLLLVIVTLGVGYWLWGTRDKPAPTVGKVLYAIPSRMQVDEEVECVIRISPESLPDRELGEGIPDSSSYPKIEAIRIGSVMTAELVGPEAAFDIILKSTQEQPILADGYTEWKFDVVPLKRGIFELTLKITVKLMVDEFGEIIKDALVLDRDVEIISEPVPELARLEEAGYFPLRASSSPGTNVNDNLDGPEPIPEAPDDPDKVNNPDREEPDNSDKVTTGTKKDNDKKPRPSVKPNRPQTVIVGCNNGFAVQPFLTTFAEQIEQQNIAYNSKPLSDCSGIFLRLCNALRLECPGLTFPEQTDARSSRQIARWYADHDNLTIIEDAAAIGRRIRPGMVLFYGQQGKTYQNPTLEDLIQPSEGIEHVGVVVSVEQDQSGKVLNYALFHGRSARKPAGRTAHHQLKPASDKWPPYGNGDQQLVAFGYILTMGKGT